MCAATTAASAPQALPAPLPGLLAGASLFLDFDGTLVDIAERPDAVVVAPELSPLLARVSRAVEGRLAIVSGRAVAEIHDLLGTDHAVSGSHGVEHAAPGADAAAPSPPPWLADAVARARAFAADWPGVLVEEKPFGLALHYRQAPEAELACRGFAQVLSAGALHLQSGKMVVELRDPGTDKGAAVRRFMAAPGWAETRPVFVGDDLTDEAGFAAAVDLGGEAVLVGPARFTAATFRLADVAAAHAWLAEAAA